MPNKKEIIHTGKTVEDAINSACELLGYKREECEWDIIDLPKSSFFGFKKTPAKVRVWVMLTEEQMRKEQAVQKKVEAQKVPAPQAKKKPELVKTQPKRETKAAPDKKEPPVLSISSDDAVTNLSEENKNKEKIAVEFLTETVTNMKLNTDIIISSRWEAGGLMLSVDGKALGVLIGRKGETLDALQYVTSLVANRFGGDYLRVIVDCGGYRAKRNQALEDMAIKGASQVLKTNISKAFEPMNAAERRILHAKISEIDGVSSSSIGKEPYRRVVVQSPTSKMPAPRNRKPRDYDDNRRSGGGGNRRNYNNRNESRERVADTPPGDIPKITSEEVGQTPLYGKVEI